MEKEKKRLNILWLLRKFRKFHRLLKKKIIKGIEQLPILVVPLLQKYSIYGLSKKSQITVVFIVIHGSVWKYDYLYKLLLEDNRYDPIIVVCPYIIFNEDVMMSELDFTYSLFSSKGYKVVSSLDSKTHKWLDIRKVFKPDIIFFTNPHPLTYKKYLIGNFFDKLTCYSQYSFHVTFLNKMQYDQLFHNILWKAFYETKYHLELAQKYSRVKGRNVSVTGFPGVDVYTDRNHVLIDPWKKVNNNVKRIIWAPHHSLDIKKKKLSYSTFLIYSDLFLKLAENYASSIQIAFKPHPLLKPKLSESFVWGKSKTDEYYSKWSNLVNGQLEEGSYEDLFLSSDALILDSASFMTEYLFTGKPSLFLVHDKDVSERFNDFGKNVFDILYHAENEVQIIDFIENIVLNENDSGKGARDMFVESRLLIKGKNSSSRIKDILDKEIFEKRV